MPTPKRPALPAGVHRKTARGKVYYYYNGAAPGEKPRLKRLPDPADKFAFGRAYADCLRARGMVERRRATLTVAALAERWQASKAFTGKAPNTQRTYGYYLPAVLTAIGMAPAEEVERQDIVALVNSYGDKTGAANMALAVTGALYRWGRKQGLVTARPTQDIDPFDSEDYEPWPEDLVEAALTADDALVRKGVAVLFFTAQRIGDSCALRWSDVRDGIIRLEQDKGEVVLSFPMHDRLRAILGAPEGITLITDGGRAVTQDKLRRRLQKWATARGHAIVPHGLRKNAVNALLEVGCSAAEAAAISGQSLQMVEHYAKRRDRARLGSAAILKWSRNGTRP